MYDGTLASGKGTLIGRRKIWSVDIFPRFSIDGQTIETTMGRIDGRSFFPGSQASRTRDFLVDGDWVVFGPDKVFLLPIEYRVVCATAARGVLLMGHASGHASSLEFDEGDTDDSQELVS